VAVWGRPAPAQELPRRLRDRGTDVQWRFLPLACLKLNNSWGLSQNATDFAPEVGIKLSF
jgi:hypothetical protein